jgi:hypothetical protein
LYCSEEKHAVINFASYSTTATTKHQQQNNAAGSEADTPIVITLQQQLTRPFLCRLTGKTAKNSISEDKPSAVSTFSADSTAATTTAA